MTQLTVDVVVNDIRSRMAVEAIPTDELPRWTATLLRPTADGVFVSDPAGRVVCGLTAGEVVGVLAGFVAAGALADAAAALRSVAAPAVVAPPIPLVRPAASSRAAAVAPAEPTPIRPTPVAAEIVPSPAPEPSPAPGAMAPTSFATPEDRPAAMKAAVEQAVDRLAEQLAAGHTEGFNEFLRFLSRFWSYSAGNCWLIALQAPHATHVAGMSTWNRMGRRVRKGERAIFVWAPVIARGKNEETDTDEERVVSFRPAAVWDASQLDGIEDNPLPTPFAVQPDDVEGLYQDIAEAIRTAGITIEERPLPAGVRGSSSGGRIALAPGMGSRERVQVLIHEAVHELGGHHTEEGRAKGRRALELELEAEATTFVVCAVLGLDAPTAADYLLNWEGDAATLRASLGTIQRLTKAMLGVIRPDHGRQLAAAA